MPAARHEGAAPVNAQPYRPIVLRRLPREVVISVRQAQCLDGLCDGMTALEMGGRFGISEDSIKTHWKRLYTALGARDRAHAVGLVLTGRVTVLVHDPQGLRRAA
jgi:DNA-binding CsgD family transcriptional regulator